MQGWYTSCEFRPCRTTRRVVGGGQRKGFSINVDAAAGLSCLFVSSGQGPGGGIGGGGIGGEPETPQATAGGHGLCLASNRGRHRGGRGGGRGSAGAFPLHHHSPTPCRALRNTLEQLWVGLGHRATSAPHGPHIHPTIATMLWHWQLLRNGRERTSKV